MYELIFHNILSYFHKLIYAFIFILTFMFTNIRVSYIKTHIQFVIYPPHFSFKCIFPILSILPLLPINFPNFTFITSHLHLWHSPTIFNPLTPCTIRPPPSIKDHTHNFITNHQMPYTNGSLILPHYPFLPKYIKSPPPWALVEFGPLHLQALTTFHHNNKSSFTSSPCFHQEKQLHHQALQQFLRHMLMPF